MGEQMNMVVQLHALVGRNQRVCGIPYDMVTANILLREEVQMAIIKMERNLLTW
jgi:hypothetical protein